MGGGTVPPWRVHLAPPLAGPPHSRSPRRPCSHELTTHHLLGFGEFFPVRNMTSSLVVSHLSFLTALLRGRRWNPYFTDPGTLGSHSPMGSQGHSWQGSGAVWLRSRPFAGAQRFLFSCTVVGCGAGLAGECNRAWVSGDPLPSRWGPGARPPRGKSGVWEGQVWRAEQAVYVPERGPDFGRLLWGSKELMGHRPGPRPGLRCALSADRPLGC